MKANINTKATKKVYRRIVWNLYEGEAMSAKGDVIAHFAEWAPSEDYLFEVLVRRFGYIDSVAYTIVEHRISE